MSGADLLFQEWSEEDEKMYGPRYSQRDEEDISIKLLGTLISNVLNDHHGNTCEFTELWNEIYLILKKHDLYYEPGK